MSALRSSFSALSRAARTLPASRSIVPVARPAIYLRLHIQPVRGYAASSGLTKEVIETRVLDVLKSFEKVSPEKVCAKDLFGDSIQLTIIVARCVNTTADNNREVR